MAQIRIIPLPPRRLSSLRSILDRNPLAFSTASKKAAGCKCRKSGCLKKYCECFLHGQKCVPGVCRCVNCQNRPSHGPPPSAFPAKPRQGQASQQAHRSPQRARGNKAANRNGPDGRLDDVARAAVPSRHDRPESGAKHSPQGERWLGEAATAVAWLKVARATASAGAQQQQQQRGYGGAAGGAQRDDLTTDGRQHGTATATATQWRNHPKACATVNVMDAALSLFDMSKMTGASRPLGPETTPGGDPCGVVGEGSALARVGSPKRGPQRSTSKGSGTGSRTESSSDLSSTDDSGEEEGTAQGKRQRVGSLAAAAASKAHAAAQHGRGKDVNDTRTISTAMQPKAQGQAVLQQQQQQQQQQVKVEGGLVVDTGVGVSAVGGDHHPAFDKITPVSALARGVGGVNF